MITGFHFLTYAHDAVKARAFFRDVLGLKSVDAGEGWLIFALPPSEWGAHPTEPGDPVPVDQPRCEMHLMCDDVHKTVAELKKKGVRFTSDVTDQGYGLVTSFEVPGAGTVGLYQPRHPTAIVSKPVTPKRPVVKKRSAVKKPAARGRAVRGRQRPVARSRSLRR